MLAIAITLPVVELHAPQPEEGDLVAGYLKLVPEYAAYALSVVLIGLYWAHSHFSGKLLQKTDHGYNLLSIGFLAAVSITPFPAGPLVEHLVGDAESRTLALVPGRSGSARDVVVRTLALRNCEKPSRSVADRRVPEAAHH